MSNNNSFGFIANALVQEELEKSLPRIQMAYKEIFSGYNISAKDVLNNVVEVENYNGLVTVENINFYTFCKHHFLPFFGTASVTYEPDKIITGLGKIVRLVRDVHAKRLQVQELMTKDIAEDIRDILGAKGVYVITSAKHLCMCSRGPNDDTTLTTVKYATGTLRRMELP